MTGASVFEIAQAQRLIAPRSQNLRMLGWQRVGAAGAQPGTRHADSGGMETTQALPSAAPQLTGCCPRFDPAPFQGACIEWRDEPFVKMHITSLFHVPLNMGKQVTRANALIEAAAATPKVPLMLSDESSPWGADLYIHVTKPVPDAQMATLSGTFLTEVFEGPFRDAPKWAEQMRGYVASKGKTIQKLYFAYTTCPACAKAYGKNYVVLFARVSQ